MELFVDFFERSVGDVGVDLGSGDGGVTKEGLNRAQVSAVTEQISRERMADLMG